MQNQATTAYQQVAKQTTSPRELESTLLSKSANKLQLIRDNWQDTPQQIRDLNEALMFNRRLWTVFVDAVMREDNPLPDNICENVANLGIFVLKQTLAVMARPSPEKLNSLISINRELAQGLRIAAGNAQ